MISFSSTNKASAKLLEGSGMSACSTHVMPFLRAII
jgi:hypothetical protein